MKNIKVFLLGFLLGFFFLWEANVFQANLERFFYTQIVEPIEKITFAKMPPRPEKPELNLQAKSALSIKVNKAGKEIILFRKNSWEVLPIASLSKLTTALVIMENTPNQDYSFSRTVTISEESASKDNVPIYGNLKIGEILSIEQLLELMLIYSSNDAAYSLAEVIDQKNFVEKMNQKVIALNFKNTHFFNPTGLDPEDKSETANYSTPNELIKISKYILQEYPLIFEITQKKGPYPLENGFSSLSLPKGIKIIGAKTGYTERAGGCMLLVLEDEDGNYYFNVILGTILPLTRVSEMQKLIDWIHP